MTDTNWRRKIRLAIAALGALLLAGCAVTPAQPDVPNGGRAVALAIGPDTMLTASESGGLFRSLDSGATWTNSTGSATFWFTDVKHLRTNPEIVIATAIADTRVVNGGGIWRSTNGGETWNQATLTIPRPDCVPGFSAYGLSTEPERRRVWAATSCGVALSDDLGATWFFLLPAPGYDRDRAYAVLTPTSNNIALLTDAGVKVTSNSGATWSLSNSGLPGSIIGGGTHNQIAVSPFTPNHLFRTFSHYDAGGRPRTALYGSWDRGITWIPVRDFPGLTRPSFVRATAPINAFHFVLYFGDGGCNVQRATVRHGLPLPAVGTWSAITVDHCDVSDIGFSAADGWSPVLLAGDGGLHATSDGGRSWTLTGGGRRGYTALQIAEVTGQLHADRRGSDQYFATLDNDIWASPDNGETWPVSVCCEGYFLNVWRDPLPLDETKVSGVVCFGCRTFLSNRLLAGFGGFPSPPNAAGAPRLLKPNTYLINKSVFEFLGTFFDVTTDGGTTWTTRYFVEEDVKDLPRVAGPVDDPVTYTAIKLSGATPEGDEIIGIKRVAGTLAAGSTLASNLEGFGRLGAFPISFTQFRPFGVDPHDANFLIVADIGSGTVKVSEDAGGSWAVDTALTSLVTQGGALQFTWGATPISQVSSIAFNPDCPGHVLVGTLQAGIFESFNRGRNWRAVPRSTLISNVSSFYFMGSNRVAVSSFGRGLWRHRYVCFPGLLPPPAAPVVLAEPVIYQDGARVPLRQVREPDNCAGCAYFITDGGDVRDIETDPRSGSLRKVALSGGTIRGLTYDRKPVEPPFEVVHADRLGKLGGNDDLRAQVKAGALIKGLYLDGSRLQGTILAERDVREEQLPRKVPLGPYTRVQVRWVEEPGGDGRALFVVVRGSGFTPGEPIAVLLDGQVMQLKTPPAVDGQGNFELALQPVIGIGRHVVLVEQRSAQGVVRDAVSFLLPPEDYEEDEGPEAR